MYKIYLLRQIQIVLILIAEKFFLSLSTLAKVLPLFINVSR